MSNIAIKVEDLSKAYQLGEIGTGTVSRDLERWWAKIRGKEDPFLRIGETNDRSVKGTSDIVWSLKDLNFEIEQGDAVGIIGKNGAGKSTLLKILSRVTSPTTGSVKVKGRIASLLEVGTGFHPELTGRENIYLNGAILGMRKHEIKKHFDAIVDFSGVERYIDTPVKRYSSGMYVRLAFAVAAHLESEILIVDEVLAVGDAEFQKKCLGKMGDVSKGEGKTVLFVSHNMTSVRSLCSKGLLLINGKLETKGAIEETINQYQYLNQVVGKELGDFDRKGSGLCRISKISILSENAINSSIHKLGEKISVEIHIKNFSGSQLDNLRIIIGIYNIHEEGYLRFDTNSTNSSIKVTGESTIVVCRIDEHLNIKPDQYSLNIAIIKNEETLDYVVGVAKFSVENYDYFESGRTIENPELSKVFYRHSWINTIN